MSFLLKDVIHNTVADAVYNEVLSRRSNYYYFIGKILEWPDEDLPPTPANTSLNEHDTRNHLIAVKKILFQDVSYVVPRINWTINTIYDQWDGDYSPSFPAYSGATKIQDALFYVLNSNFYVYKCLFNKNNSPSTEEPYGTDAVPLQTLDGYVWKYLYTIPLSLRNRFLTTEFMPVSRSVFNPFYTNGSIDGVTIEDKGINYQGNAEVSLVVNGEFKGADGNVVASIVPVFDYGGQIANVVIRNPGNNYTSANITIVESLQTGSSLFKNLIGVSILNPGSGYTAPVIANTSATITTTGLFQPTENATISLNFSNEALTSALITNAGRGYSNNIVSNTTLTITSTSSPNVQAVAALTFANNAILTPIIFNNKIDRVLIEDPGIGYRSNLKTTLVVTGDGANAQLLPFVNDIGELEDVIITNKGEGYTFARVDVVGPGTNAEVEAQISSGDLESTQSIVELSAVAGAIHTLRVLDEGEGYTFANVTVAGDGINFLGNVIFSNTNTISYVEVLNPGSGYTFANVIITGDGANANVTAIISPQNGHGNDAIDELYADTLMFYSTINSEPIHNRVVDNDYRQFGIIKDLERFQSRRTFIESRGTSCFLITVNTILDVNTNRIVRDTILRINNDASKLAEVVEIYDDNKLLITNINNVNIQLGQTLTDPLTGSSYTILLVDRQPTINKFSGELLFINNRTQVSYSEQQLVTLRTTIKF